MVDIASPPQPPKMLLAKLRLWRKQADILIEAKPLHISWIQLLKHSKM
jgi:hypothetical protein